LIALQDALEAHAGETFAVVSHGVTLRVVLMGLLPAQAEQLRYAEIGNASITTLHHDGATWTLDQLSYVGHLDEIPAVRGEAATW
jgi:broad specificity phosphatase PhoE